MPGPKTLSPSRRTLRSFSIMPIGCTVSRWASTRMPLPSPWLISAGVLHSRMSPKPSRPGMRSSLRPRSRNWPSTWSTTLLTDLASWLGLSIDTHSTMPAKTSSASIFGSFLRGAVAMSDRVPGEVFGRALEVGEVGLHRRHGVLGDRLEGPALGVVHRTYRTVGVEQHDLVHAHAEDLRGDAGFLRGVRQQEHRHRRDLGRGHAL